MIEKANDKLLKQIQKIKFTQTLTQITTHTTRISSEMEKKLYTHTHQKKTNTSTRTHSHTQISALTIKTHGNNRTNLIG